MVLRPTRPKIGHFGDVSPSQSLGLVYRKITKPSATTVRITNQKKCTTTQKKLKPGLVTFYDIRPGNEAGLFSKEQISKGGEKSEKSEENKVKWSSREAYDIKKGNGSPYSITERGVPELIPVLGSQPAGES